MSFGILEGGSIKVPNEKEKNIAKVLFPNNVTLRSNGAVWLKKLQFFEIRANLLNS